MITVTIDKDGDQVFLKGHGAEIFAEAGESRVRRASHVLPDGPFLRACFRAVRLFVSDTSTLAAWTRTWKCLWRVDTSPIGGPILCCRWRDREQAIQAEIQFLNNFFLEKK